MGAVVLVGAAAGCTVDRSGNAPSTDLLGPDTGAPVDSMIVPDTADDVAADEGIDVADSADAADTATDTGVDAPDTSVPILTMAVAPVVIKTVDLTSEGKLAWVHWGLTDTTSVNTKLGSTLISPLTGSAWGRYDAYPTTFTWSDGSPTAVVTGTRTALYVTTTGAHFAFTVRADTSVRVLRAYIEAGGSSGKVTVSLSDGSAPALMRPVPADGSVTSGLQTFVATVQFAAASGTATLAFDWAKGVGGDAAIYGASVSTE